MKKLILYYLITGIGLAFNSVYGETLYGNYGGTPWQQELNKGLLNATSYINYNGLNNKEVSTTLNNAALDFTALPFSNFYINPYIIKSPTSTDVIHNSISYQNYLGEVGSKLITERNLLAEGAKLSYGINSNYTSGINAVNNNASLALKADNFSLLMALNFIEVKNLWKGQNNPVNNLYFNNYNSLLSYTYAPFNSGAYLRLSNITYNANTRQSLANKKAEQAFNGQVLAENVFGNLFNAEYGYSSTPEGFSYNSNLYLNNQFLSFRKDNNLLNNNDIKIKTLGYNLKTVHNFGPFSNNALLIYGVSAKLTKINSNNLPSFQNPPYLAGKEVNYGAFLGAASDISAVNNLKVTGEVAFKHFSINPKNYNNEGSSNIHNNFAYNTNIIYTPWPFLKVYGGYSKELRAPALSEKYLKGSYFINGYLVNFNPNFNLLAEKSNSFKGGYEVKLKNANEQKVLSFSGNINTRKISNYITESLAKDDKDNLNAKFINIPLATITAYELEISGKLYNLEGAITYNKVTGKDKASNYLNNLPPGKLTATVNYYFTKTQSRLIISSDFYQKVNQNNNYLGVPEQKNKGFTSVNAKVTQNLWSPNNILAIGVTNIFNNGYLTPLNLNYYTPRTYFIEVKAYL